MEKSSINDISHDNTKIDYNIETNSLEINELIDTIKELSRSSSTNEEQLQNLGNTLIEKINNIPCELRNNPNFVAIENKLEDYQKELKELQKGGYRKKKTRYNKKTNTQKKQTKKYNMQGGVQGFYVYSAVITVVLTIFVMAIRAINTCVDAAYDARANRAAARDAIINNANALAYARNANIRNANALAYARDANIANANRFNIPRQAASVAIARARARDAAAEADNNNNTYGQHGGKKRKSRKSRKNKRRTKRIFRRK